jgi:hypothetical protein
LRLPGSELVRHVYPWILRAVVFVAMLVVLSVPGVAQSNAVLPLVLVINLAGIEAIRTDAKLRGVGVPRALYAVTLILGPLVTWPIYGFMSRRWRGLWSAVGFFLLVVGAAVALLLIN